MLYVLQTRGNAEPHQRDAYNAVPHTLKGQPEMTRTIKSETTNKHYFLTIENGQAIDCSCPDRQYRHHACKHMKHYNAAFEQAIAFAALVALFDCRSQAVIEAKRAAYYYYEMAIQAA